MTEGMDGPTEIGDQYIESDIPGFSPASLRNSGGGLETEVKRGKDEKKPAFKITLPKDTGTILVMQF